MTWSYRVTNDDTGWSVIEVYFENGKIMGWTEPVLGPFDTLDELMEDVQSIMDCFDLDPVELDT